MNIKLLMFSSLLPKKGFQVSIPSFLSSVKMVSSFEERISYTITTNIKDHCLKIHEVEFILKLLMI